MCDYFKPTSGSRDVANIASFSVYPVNITLMKCKPHDQARGIQFVYRIQKGTSTKSHIRVYRGAWPAI